jgi:hypothetical protein
MYNALHRKINPRHPGSLVGKAAGYELDGRDSIPIASRPVWGAPGLPSNGRGGVKRQGREAEHSPPSDAEVKNSEATPPLPHASSWHLAQFLKHRDNFTFTLHGFHATGSNTPRAALLNYGRVDAQVPSRGGGRRCSKEGETKTTKPENDSRGRTKSCFTSEL